MNMITERMTRLLQLLDARYTEALSDNVTPRQIVVLKAISQRSRCSQTDLVLITGMDRSTMADVMRRLIKRKLVERKRSKADARAYEVSISAEGAVVLSRALKAIEAVDKEIGKIKTAAALKKAVEDVLGLLLDAAEKKAA
jgi:MarR family transcriptional regulator, temperature-dependent positive regulator of motility